jgi:Trypsin
VKLLLRAVAALALFGAGLVPAVSGASAARAWAPAGKATIHPGVQTFTKGAQCTANFVFRSGRAVYLGQAAHCSGTGDSTETDGCTSKSLPLGTHVTFAGVTGKMIYNSWITMQKQHEKRPNVCAYNDLALIRIPRSAVAKVNPSVPFWGGPTGLGGATPTGATVYSYGNSELRGGVTTLSPKRGVSTGDDGNGWSHTVYTATPGVPGDSGSGFLNAKGRAIGVLSTITLAPLAASNGVGDLAHELAYLHAHTKLRATLVHGTEPFRPNGGS